VWKACKEWLLANKALYNNPKFVEALATVDVSVEGIEALPTDLDETKSVQHKVLKALRWVQEYTMANDLVAYYNLFPYKFIVIDTITEVETAANTKALADYAKTKQGAGALAKNPEAKNIMDLDIDTKWLKSRETVIELMVNRLSDACPHGILLGHVRDKYVGQEGVDMKKEKVLALTGQLGNLVMSKMDVIGYVEAKKNPVTKELERKLNFLTGKDNKAMGSRIPRLDGKILDLDGAWPHIFPFLETNTNN
jgi:hypothetical protein